MILISINCWFERSFCKFLHIIDTIIISEYIPLYIFFNEMANCEYPSIYQDHMIVIKCNYHSFDPFRISLSRISLKILNGVYEIFDPDDLRAENISSDCERWIWKVIVVEILWSAKTVKRNWYSIRTRRYSRLWWPISGKLFLQFVVTFWTLLVKTLHDSDWKLTMELVLGDLT